MNERELPALGHGARDDRGGGVHEDELEQEEGEDAHVVGSVSKTAEEEALVSEEPPAGGGRERMVEGCNAAKA